MSRMRGDRTAGANSAQCIRNNVRDKIIAMATPIPRNQSAFTLAEVVEATGGRLRHSARPGVGLVLGVGIDTRSLEPGSLFVALRGTTFDGHNYLAQAAELGAAAAIVETGRQHLALDCIEVDDALVALGRLAHRHLARRRAARSLPVIAIGGAVGKTTTKELTAAVTRALFGATLSTPGNLNNLVGVPMTIFTLTGAQNAAVLECGTNTRGEIPKLARIVEPDVAMVLNVDLEHTEGLGALDDIADEEAAMFSTARRYAVASADEPLVLARIPRNVNRITFGKSPDAIVRLAHRSIGARSRIRIELDAKLVSAGLAPLIETEIALLGETAALNCTAAIAGLAAMRASPFDAANLAAIAEALASVKPVAGRLSTSTIRGIVVIDDSYNSNPRSIRAALSAAREVADGLGARLVIAMGDMLELGAMSAAAHQDAIRDIMREQPAGFVAVGSEMRTALEFVAGAKLPANVLVAPDSAAAANLVAGLVHAGDVLLIKGSRGIAMERIIAALS
jgi:UDP-N-acetylmuramoyl-tripeptide--D-alanyl-D-alanine ligase